MIDWLTELDFWWSKWSKHKSKRKKKKPFWTIFSSFQQRSINNETIENFLIGLLDENMKKTTIITAAKHLYRIWSERDGKKALTNEIDLTLTNDNDSDDYDNKKKWIYP